MFGPQPQSDPVIREALTIAIDYLDRTGQAGSISEIARVCALIILQEWQAGRRHRIWLANKAITTIEGRTSAPQSATSMASGSMRGH
jgi:hypothetical protein